MGTWDFANMPPIPAAKNSLDRMVSLLTGPLCGWPRDRLFVIENEPGPGDLPDRLITAFEHITGVALFYYVGHGQLDSDDQLCLSLTETRTEPNRRATTSLSFQAVRRAMLDSHAVTKIVLVDCCFSGLAALPTNTLAGRAGYLADVTAVPGAYTMTACGAFQTAWYETGPGIAEPETYFTKFLAQLVEDGIPGQPAALRLHQLFLQLRDTLGRQNRPVPEERNIGAGGEFVFAHNAAPPDTHYDPEAQIRQLNQQITKAEARTRTLEAQLEERTRELARVHEQEGPVPSAERRDAITVAERRLAETAGQLNVNRAERAAVEARRSGIAATAAHAKTPQFRHPVSWLRRRLPPQPRLKKRSRQRPPGTGTRVVARRRPLRLRMLTIAVSGTLLAVLFAADSAPTASGPGHIEAVFNDGAGDTIS